MGDSAAIDRRTFLKLGGAAVGAAALGGLSAPAAFASSTNTALDFGHDVATAWFDRINSMFKTTPGFSPPVASRMLGYSGVTLYQALVVGMPGYKSLTRHNSAFPEILGGSVGLNWPLVANSALSRLVSLMMPNATDAEKAANASLGTAFQNQYRVGVSPGLYARSLKRGVQVANAVFEWSKTDGGHEAYLNTFPAYTVPTGPQYWVPTPPAFQATPLQAYWGNNRCFVIGHGAGVGIADHPEYSEAEGSDFYALGMEVYETKQNLTTEQSDIALFWGDGGGTITPPGHSVSTATQAIRQEALSLGAAADVYAKVGMAVADAFIECWYWKYRYHLLRPVTYIQRVIDPTWLPLLATPPFPEHGSGHSTNSGAAATVLTAIFGDNYAYTDDTHAGVYPARSFSSFQEAADEAAVSRLYGGIHYSTGNNHALSAGRAIGAAVAAVQTRK
jgi:PAP2 superfamily/TAT (twin-arginine translocation) pathway signal sequence